MKNVLPTSPGQPTDCHPPLLSQQGLAADLASQCMLGVPSYDRPLVQGDTNDLPVTINADHAKGDYPDDAVFTGSVDIMQGNSRLQADEVQLHQKEAPGQPEPVRTVDALGNVHYDDNQVILKGPKGWANLNTKDTTSGKVITRWWVARGAVKRT